MREIKFRGKIHNGEWVYGSLVYFSNSVFVIHYEIGTATIRRFDWCYVDPDTVGQFTGLKDCNGKEIYEGDIIRSYDSKGDEIIHIIEHYDEEACFIARLNGYSKDDFGCGPVRQSWINEFKKEAIGNIHDNPELIKQCNE